MWLRYFTGPSKTNYKLITIALLGCTLTTIQRNARANDVNERAVELVSRAMQAESDGELVERERLLVKAAAMARNLPIANWYLGKVQEPDGAWATVEDSVKKAASQRWLAEYEAIRAKRSSTVQDHWQLATWCADRRLVDQCRAHLFAIINIEPDHRAARAALGYQLVNDEWVSPEKIDELAAQAQQAETSLSEYGPRLQRIFRGAESDSVAISQLAQIKDPLAIPAAEMLATSLSDAACNVMIRWIDTFDSPDASKTLARFALLHPATEVRQMASEKLRGKPMFDYMPELLAGLSSPIQATLVPATNRRGQIVGYRQAFSKEEMNETRVLLFDRSMSWRGRQDFALMDRQNVQLQSMAQSALTVDAQNAERIVEIENLDITATNKRLVSLISDVSGQKFAEVPQDVWKWWDKYNETNYQAYKPSRYRRDALDFEVPQYAPSGFHGECFVVGTMISTQRGLKPIEQINVGDMALSRNESSGELCWKPVIARTTRPPEPTVVLTIDDETLQCTGGHLFWISGKGWVRASQVMAGEVMHAASVPAVVTAVQQAGNEQTYNLEIADNHTYFAGKCLVLSHDVTPRGVSRNLVPGQMEMRKR